MKHFFIAALFTLAGYCSIAQGWVITGNAGTNPATDFVGTKDKQPLVFRTNNVERMRIQTSGNVGIGANAPSQKLDVNGNINIRNGFGLYFSNRPIIRPDTLHKNLFIGDGITLSAAAGSYNTITGFNAFHADSTGYNNAAYGANTLYANITGNNNIASGVDALYSNTSGSYNSAYGAFALLSNTDGNYNTATGHKALYFNQSGSYNTASGYLALYYNKSSYLTATGYGALYTNTTGGFNVATGSFSMYNNQTGSSSAAYGYSSLYGNQTGNYNTAMGPLALYSNYSGSYNTALGYRALFTSNGANNTASGWEALYSNTSGNDNTAHGFAALYSLTTGYYNTAVGNYALYNTIDSYGNTAIGDIAGASYHNGYYNCFIGAETDVNGAGYYNVIALGHGTVCTAPSQARVGNSATTSIGGYVGWSNISDERVKRNIKDNVPGLQFINKLKPLTYTLDLNAADKIIQPNAAANKVGERTTVQTNVDKTAREAKEKIVYTGFIAQDVEKAAKELNYDFSGVDAPKNNKDLYGLRYAEFVVPLVKAVQQLSQENEDLKRRLDKLESQVAAQQSNSNAISSNNTIAGITLLQQNVPNPFSQSTRISYNLPQTVVVAKIIIADNSGKTLKEVNITSKGNGSITVDAGALAAGTYTYTLYADGKKIDSRQMAVAK